MDPEHACFGSILYATQRHYRTQRSDPQVDGLLEVDLRTLREGGAAGVRHQPEWVAAIYTVLTRKRSNIQAGLTARIPYGSRVVQSRNVLDLVAGVWIAQSPLIGLIVDE